jgi:Sugar phosphate permease
VSQNKQGFFYGWVVVICCFLATFCYGIFYTFGVFFKPLQAEFGWSATVTSSVHSLHLFIGIFSTLLVGWATDKFGPRVTLACGGTLLGIGISLLSQVSDLWHFYLFYGIASLGVGALWTLPNATVMRWFSKARGLTLGIVVAGIGAGALVYAPAANSLILSYGWRTTYIIIGVGTWILLMIAAGLIASSPEKKGLKPYGIEEVTVESTNVEVSGDSKEWRTGEWTFREASKTRAFWLLAAIYFCTVLPIHMAIVHVVPFALSIGIGKTAAASALALIGGLSIAGRIGVGTAAQKIGFSRALIICAGMCAAMFAWLQGVQSLWMLYLFAVIYGFFYGGKVPQVSGLIGYCFPGNSLATIFGTINAISMVGGVLGPLIGGFVWDTTGSYQIAFIIGASFWALAAILTLFLRPPRKVAAASMG